jgi:DNA-binding NarL/FixJ family response regulator
LNVKDMTSEYAQRAKGIKVERLDRYDQEEQGWQEIVVEDRHAGPADIATTRIDFRNWLNELTERQRSIANLLAVGETTRAVATKVGITDGRVSQVRRELMVAWREFQGDFAVA